MFNDWAWWADYGDQVNELRSVAGTLIATRVTAAPAGDDAGSALAARLPADLLIRDPAIREHARAHRLPVGEPTHFQPRAVRGDADSTTRPLTPSRRLVSSDGTAPDSPRSGPLTCPRRPAGTRVRGGHSAPVAAPVGRPWPRDWWRPGRPGPVAPATINPRSRRACPGRRLRGAGRSRLRRRPVIRAGA